MGALSANSIRSLSSGNQMQYMVKEACILVDMFDKTIGSASKLDCHQFKSQKTDASLLPLHRAFSLFIFDQEGNMLVQKRANCKLTFPGRWTNTCCSHPLMVESTEEPILEAVVRKAIQELNLDVSKENLHPIGRIHYWAPSNDIYGEHELDHLVFGQISRPLLINPNPEEVGDVAWIDKSKLAEWIKDPSISLTPWFRMISEKLILAENIWDKFTTGKYDEMRKILPNDQIIRLSQ